MKDIAEKFGVSVSTVSRALSGSTRVRKDKRDAICQYAREHDFYPNNIAQSLRNSKREPVRLIGVIVPELTHYYFASVLTGIEEAATARGYRIIITMSKESYEREAQICQMFEAHQVCGVIVSQAKDTTRYDHFKSLLNKGITLVFFDRICTGVDASLVVVDDYQGAFKAVSHLIETGIKPEESLVIACDNRCDAERITPGMLERDDRPDAFFCVNDDTAIGVMYTAKRMGFSIPDDISVCGFTNGNRAVACDPMLTTVEQRGVEVGKEAATILIDKVEKLSDPDKIEKRVVRTRLVVRGSSR